MNTGDACVPDSHHTIAHCLGSQSGFFGNRNVARAGGRDADLAAASVRSVTHQTNQFCRLVPLSIRRDISDIAKNISICASDKHIWSTLDQAFVDLDDLLFGLAKTENDLRKTLPRGACVIDLCVTDVFV